MGHLVLQAITRTRLSFAELTGSEICIRNIYDYHIF